MRRTRNILGLNRYLLNSLINTAITLIRSILRVIRVILMSLTALTSQYRMLISNLNRMLLRLTKTTRTGLLNGFSLKTANTSNNHQGRAKRTKTILKVRHSRTLKINLTLLSTFNHLLNYRQSVSNITMTLTRLTAIGTKRRQNLKR